MFRFQKGVIQDPKGVGAIAPSSKRLVSCILDASNIKNARHVVELGPGTGAFTKEITKRVPEDATFFAIERNRYFRKVTQKKFPKIPIYLADAVNLRSYLTIENLPNYDCIISSLPWTLMDKETQGMILEEIVASMAPGGEFLTIIYKHGENSDGAINFRYALERNFGNLGKTRTIIRNDPPAFGYRCIK